MIIEQAPQQDRAEEDKRAIRCDLLNPQALAEQDSPQE